MRTLKLIRFTVLIVTLFFTSISCTNDNKEEPITPPESFIEDFNQTNMSFSEEAGEQTFSFTANGDWTVDVASTSGGNVWCKASPTEGRAGSQTVKITTTENDTYDDRSVTVTLKSGDESKTFVVTQKQKDAILINSNKIEVEQKGGTITIEVKANVNYTTTIGETCKDWITESSNTRALSSTEKKYSIALNEHGEKREGTITFTNGTLSETVHIYQAGGDIILLSKNEYYVDAAGEDITVELRSNCEYEVEMPAVDWIHTTSSRSMSSHTLYYTIDTNETYDSRKAKIIYRNKEKNVADTLTIIQAQKAAIILGNKYVNVKAEGENIGVKLSANVEYEVKMPNVDWITTINTRGLTEHTLYYKVEKNEGEDSRSSKITFRNIEHGLEETLNIIQEGNRPEIIIINVPVEGTLSSITERVDFKALKLTGRLNGYDVNAIRRMTKLKYLDISEVDIIGGEYYFYDNYYGGYDHTLEDNTIGFMMFTNDVQVPTPFQQLTEVLLPHSVTNIERYAFFAVQSLYKIELPKSLKIIGESAFWQCSNIAKITIPNGVATIDDEAFRECSNLYSITIPNSVTKIGYGVLEECEKLTEVSLPDNLEEISSNTFRNCVSLKDVNIPESVKRIRSSAFYGCRNIKNISIPKGVIEIGSYAFQGCSSLTNITIPNGVTRIGKSAFSECNISNVTIPESVTEVEAVPFDKLNEVKIFCKTPPSGYIKCNTLYIPKGTYQKYILTNWAAYATNMIEMEE